jgi:hypothetical protein
VPLEFMLRATPRGTITDASTDCEDLSNLPSNLKTKLELLLSFFRVNLRKSLTTAFFSERSLWKNPLTGCENFIVTCAEDWFLAGRAEIEH